MSIEEIEKAILPLNIHECDIEDIFETLDKYIKQQTLATLKDFENVSNKLIDYKSAFDNLNKCLKSKSLNGELRDDYQNAINDIIDEIKKFNLGGE